MRKYLYPPEIHPGKYMRQILYGKSRRSVLPVIYVPQGERLKAVSDKFLEDIVNINAFGFLPIKPFFILKEVYKKIKKHFIDERPDKVILVDYYGFHSFVAKLAKKMNIPVYYYVSPQVWASRKGRIKTIAKNIKKMLCILPFEEKLYKDNEVDAVFVGNPLIDMVSERRILT